MPDMEFCEHGLHFSCARCEKKRVAQVEVERDQLREALEEIQAATVDHHDPVSTTVYAIATVALDPKGCREWAGIPEPLPGCDCPKCGHGHMVEEVQYAGFKKCDHCNHADPF